MTEMICIVCPNGCRLEVNNENGEIKVNGNKCPRGAKFAVEELTAPKRSVTTSVKTIYKEFPVVSVRTDGEIPKEKIPSLMKEVGKIVADKPYETGDIIMKNLFGTGVNLIVTTNLKRLMEE